MPDTRTDELEAILLRDPFDTNTRCLYARALADTARWDDANEQFSLLVRQSPEDPRGPAGLARCALASGDEVAARAALERARELDGFEVEPWMRALIVEVAIVNEPPREVEHVAQVHHLGVERPVRFDDIIGMDALKKTIRSRIIDPFARPGLFARFKRKSGGGVLLYGPPGCGKTMIARAVATEVAATFIPVGVAEILSAWSGESERNLAHVFEHARARKPAVLFFDELDALAFSRTKAHSEHSRRLVTEFLTQLDGTGTNTDGLLVLAASNLPWDIDPAMRRPGRFDRSVFVPPPDATARAAMFASKLTDVPTGAIDHDTLARLTQHFSGADIDGVIDLAKDTVLSDIIDSGVERPLTHEDLVDATTMHDPTTLDWLHTARTLVKFGGARSSWKDVEAYLKSAKLF